LAFIFNLNFLKNLDLLKKRIKKNEGFRSSLYSDQLGNPTIGYGHFIRNNENFTSNKKYPKKQLKILFEKDFNIALRGYNKNYKKFNYKNNTAEVLIEMIYQLGINGQKKFKRMNKYLKQNNLFMASFEMKNSLWYQQTPKRVNSLIIILLSKK